MENIELENTVHQVRRDILRMVHKVNSGHPGGSLGCAEFLVALYFKAMKLKPGFDMNGMEEDLFFLSGGAGSSDRATVDGGWRLGQCAGRSFQAGQFIFEVDEVTPAAGRS